MNNFLTLENYQNGAAWQAHQSIRAHATSQLNLTTATCVVQNSSQNLAIYKRQIKTQTDLSASKSRTLLFRSEIDRTPLLELFIFLPSLFPLSLSYYMYIYKWGLKAQHLFQSCKLNGGEHSGANKRLMKR